MYCVAFLVFDGRLKTVYIGSDMVENDGEDEEIVVGRPWPGSPMREVTIEE